MFDGNDSSLPHENPVSRQVEETINALTLKEKIYMMSGHGMFQIHSQSGVWGSHPYQAGGGCERLNIEPLYFTDGPRGVSRNQSTCFPCTMARGASFDVDLEQRIGEAMAIEARAQGCNLSGAVCINLLRHPAWGRSQETYGEDSHHLGEMGAALSQGIQTHNVIATVKHFALNSMENARFLIDVKIDDRTLYEIYLPHFKRVIDSGCASVMSAYNQVNGEYCGQNRRLLTDILRHEWGFEGFVHSDWVKGLNTPYAAQAGLDIENPEPIYFGKKLEKLVEDGSISVETINTACRRILTTFFKFELAEDPLENYTLDLVSSETHIALAQEAAEKSATLLKNDEILPFCKEETKKIGIFGKLSTLANLGDNGSSKVRPRHVITPREGIQSYLGEEHEFLFGDEDDLNIAHQNAAQADATIVVVGYTAKEEGEFIPDDVQLGQETSQSNVNYIGGDRDELTLPSDQVALINTIYNANPNTVIVIVSGSAVIMSNWSQKVGAIMQTYYAGMNGGAALARLIFGDVSPSGKLPFSIAVDETHYPYFDKNADTIEYDYWHGYALLDKENIEPEYCFGHGLSYSQFDYRALKANLSSNDEIEVQVSIANNGEIDATEVAQLYVSPPGQSVARAQKLLKSFQRVEIPSGRTKTIRMSVPIADLCWYDPASRNWVLENGVHEIMVGGSSKLAEQLSTQIVL